MSDLSARRSPIGAYSKAADRDRAGRRRPGWRRRQGAIAHLPPLSRVWELRANLTVFDAAYVALAEALEVPLLTGDGRVARAPGLRCDVEPLRTSGRVQPSPGPGVRSRRPMLIGHGGRVPDPRVPDPAEWLLRKSERGNPRTVLDDQHPGERAWSDGNTVRPLIHGSTYFAELYERIEETREGDLLFFTDWQGDADERLTGERGSEVVEVLGRADERGVDVRGLVWRSHSRWLGFTSEVNARLGKQLQDRGAEALLDMRIRMGGSHHQKICLLYTSDAADE